MRTDLKDRLHSLRIWANAARHLDDDRWRRDGPRGEAEASQLVSAVKMAIEALEGLEGLDQRPHMSRARTH